MGALLLFPFRPIFAVTPVTDSLTFTINSARLLHKRRWFRRNKGDLIVHRDWAWISRYVLVIVISLVLGGAIGEFSLFKQTALGTPKLTASALVQFMGYGGALLLLWLLGQRSANQFRQGGGKAAFLSFIIVPLVTLIVMAGAYSVLLTMLRPFLDASLRNIYNWVFVLGITASALWLAIALFHHSEPLVDLFRSEGSGRMDGEVHKCPACEAALVPGAKYCHVCGTPGG